MRNILARGNRKALERFARSNVLAAFDFDGTLAPIVPQRGHAAMRTSTRAYLVQLNRLYPCVVISGRGSDDVAKLLKGTGIVNVVGNHGVDGLDDNARWAQAVRRWHPVLAHHLQACKGVEIEDKGYSLSIHYRHSRQQAKAHAAILKAVGELEAVRVIGGHRVVNVLPLGAPHKGAALERERDRLKCDTAIFVGDDDTDEDVFTLDQPERLLSIRVGAKKSSMARYCIRDQKQIDDLLRALIELRETAADKAK